MRLPKDAAMLALGLFLILYGLFAILPAISFAGANIILGLLALIAGALLLLRR